MASLPYSCRAVFSGAQGSMEITEDALVWQKEGGPRQTLVAWADVSKHAIAPPNNPKALVKIDLKAGGSIKFEVLPPVGGARTARDVSVDCKEVITLAKRASAPAGASSSASVGSSGGGGGSSSAAGGKGKGDAESAARWKSDELLKKKELQKARKEIAERAAEQVRSRMRELEKETRRSLLEQHPDLREQYNQMVGEGLISEEDFWDARRRMLLEEQAKREARRNKGVPSNILAEIESRAGECANNNVVKLKPRDIQFLFDLYPGLRELHRKKVPEEISEGKFWEQTLRSIRFHRQRASLSQDEYFQAQALPTVNAKDNKEDLRRVDPVFDLMADEQGLQGRRRATANDKAGTDNDMSKDGLTTVSKLNRGCGLLVRTRHVGQVSEYTDMPDLRAEQPSMAFQKLQLRNRDLYTTSSVTALEREALPDAPLPPVESCHVDLSAYTPDLPSAFADPRVASWVLDTLSERALATSGAVGGLEEQEVEESLPKAYVEFSRVSEFLRHFHAFHHRRLSGQASEEVCAKLERLVEKMDQKNKELAALRTSLHKTYKGRSALAHMLYPFQTQLTHAIELHDAYTRAPPPPPPVRAPSPTPSSRGPTPTADLLASGGGTTSSGRNTPVGFGTRLPLGESPPEVEIIPSATAMEEDGQVEGAGQKRPREAGDGEEGAAKAARAADTPSANGMQQHTI